MSDKKARLTVTVDQHLADFAEQLVETGRAPSVSAVLNEALTQRLHQERRARAAVAAKVARADPARVARMRAHADAQAAVLGYEAASGE